MIKKARKGDQSAFLAMFSRYEGDLYRMAYVYLNNQEDALDAVQETAYRSFKSISGLKEASFLKTWLIRIAIRCSIDLLRKRDKVVAIRPEHTELLAAREEEDVPLSLTLRELIDGLDEEEKSVILLRFYHDYTIKETADILEIPLGSCKTVLYRALAKLRKRLKVEDVHEQ